MTVAELIKASYANLGALDIESDLTPAQYATGLQSLNSMLGSWSRIYSIYGLVDESFALTPGQAEYTVVSGGNFNTSWAYSIESAYIRDSNGIDYPVQIITPGQYDNVSLKTVSSRPENLLYNPKGYPTGRATLYHVPDQAYDLYWTAQKPLNSYSSIEDTLGIAPEYEEPIEYNLSVRLAPKVGVAIPPEVAKIARESKSLLPVYVDPAAFDGAFDKGRRYNIYSDQI